MGRQVENCEGYVAGVLVFGFGGVLCWRFGLVGGKGRVVAEDVIDVLGDCGVETWMAGAARYDGDVFGGHVGRVGGREIVKRKNMSRRKRWGMSRRWN